MRSNQEIGSLPCEGEIDPSNPAKTNVQPTHSMPIHIAKVALKMKGPAKLKDFECPAANFLKDFQMSEENQSVTGPAPPSIHKVVQIKSTMHTIISIIPITK